MNGWYTLQELAGLPGMCSTSAAVLKVAKKNLWPSRKKLRGKGLEYPLSCLPAETRAALQARAIEAAVVSLSTVAPAATLPAGAPPLSLAPAALFSTDLTDRQRLERDARTGVLAALKRIRAEAGCSQAAALTTLLTNARAGRLDGCTDRMLRLARDPRGRAGDGYPSVTTLKRWVYAKDLAPKVPRPDLTVPDWADVFLREYQQPQKPSVAEAYKGACKAWPAGQRPSIHQVRRFLARLGTVTRERGRMGERELKNIRPFVRRTFELLEPNDVWTADGHTFDAEVQHPLHGRPFRPEITTFLDVATRRAVGWSVGLAESAHAVADALRHGVEHNGIPAILYVDNGSGYKNAFLADEATGLLGRLGVTIEHSLPYNSQARGVIERAHKTLWVTGAKQLPSYMGAAMDREARLEQFKLTRKALKNGGAMPLMPWHLFVEFCEQRIAEYNARPHSALGKISPDAAWANHIAKGWEAVRLADVEAATLFRPRVARKLDRAEIRLFGNLYFARELEEFHDLQAHIGYDIHDASKVWVYAPDGRLICEAHINGNAKHYFPVPVIEQARQKRAKGRLACTDAKREEIMAELHGTPALAVPAAGQIVIGGRILDTAALAERHAVLEATDTAPEPAAPAAPQPDIRPRPRSERSADENYADWLALDETINAGTEVSEADARWHRSYPNSAQYKAQAKKTATSAQTRVA